MPVDEAVAIGCLCCWYMVSFVVFFFSGGLGDLDFLTGDLGGLQVSSLPASQVLLFLTGYFNPSLFSSSSFPPPADWWCWWCWWYWWYWWCWWCWWCWWWYESLGGRIPAARCLSGRRRRRRRRGGVRLILGDSDTTSNRFLATQDSKLLVTFPSCLAT